MSASINRSRLVWRHGVYELTAVAEFASSGAHEEVTAARSGPPSCSSRTRLCWPLDRLYAVLLRLELSGERLYGRCIRLLPLIELVGQLDQLCGQVCELTRETLQDQDTARRGAEVSAHARAWLHGCCTPSRVH